MAALTQLSQETCLYCIPDSSHAVYNRPLINYADLKLLWLQRFIRLHFGKHQ